VVQEFGGKVRFAVENYGDSALARRFGVTRYPVIFAGDVLVATPKDFGFYGKGGEGGGEGRYSPLRSAASRERFRADLRRVLELLLAGRRADAGAHGTSIEAAAEGRLPAFSLTDLDGRAVSQADLAGRVVLVEFWSTWCPLCRGTLRWLGELQKQHGDRVAVVAIAVESDEADVRKLVAGLGLPIRWAMGTPALARAFGDVSALPLLHVFDGGGRNVGSWLGAPPTLHAEVEAALVSALAR
jgi:thiol-disulfide isomerase/thioredoxin